MPPNPGQPLSPSSHTLIHPLPQWNSQKHGGFTTGTPWMRANDDYVHCNAEQQQADPTSVFAYWRQLLRLRKQHVNVLVYGGFELLAAADPVVLCYRRVHPSGTATVVLNFTDHEHTWLVPPAVVKSWATGRRILANYAQSVELGTGKTVLLKPFETLVFLKRQETLHL
jgi:alpha-glucosidase